MDGQHAALPQHAANTHGKRLKNMAQYVEPGWELNVFHDVAQVAGLDMTRYPDILDNVAHCDRI